ncbi:DUF6660 family protein [Pedobacter steynii]|uniref:DUF6660 family protein n=1 Tax=Pedobacter steynii TaxID=430522 RepID=UPI00373FE1B6
MKLLACILSLIIIGLTFMPCEDGQLSNLSSAKSVISKSDIHDQNEPLKDGCPPFCICSCCSIMAIIKDEVTSLSIPYIQRETNSAAYSASITHANFSIWQPPKLSQTEFKT